MSLPPYAVTAGRAVYLNLRPRPVGINASREIVALLQQYGKLEMYQSLGYHPAIKAPNLAIAVYKEQHEAKRLIEASPLQLAMPRSSQQSKLSPHQDDICVRIQPSYLNHQSLIQRQHYYSSFEPDRYSIAFADLEKKVPMLGMADCQTQKKEVHLRLRMRRAEKEQREKRGQWKESLTQLWNRGKDGNLEAI